MDGLTTRHLIPSHLKTFPPCSLTCPEGTQFTHPSRTQGKPSVYHLRATRTSSHLKSQSSAFRSLNPQPSALYYALGCKPPPHNESQVRRVERRLNCYAISALLRQRPEVRGNVVRELISGDRNQKLEAANNRGCAAFTRHAKDKLP